MDFSLIETDAGLRELIERFADSDAVIIDTEFMRRDTFFPKAALFQLCFPAQPQTGWLVDPLKVSDFAPLRQLFSDESVVKVLHSASEDLEVFQKFLGCQPTPLFDTQRAAAFTGLRFGLGYRALVEAVSGIHIDKEQTRSNWLARPLSEEQLLYAAADVVHLLPVYRHLEEGLAQHGRLQWVLEDSATAAHAASQPAPPSFLRVKTAWKLDSRALAILQELCDWRDERARRLDKPRSWILSDKLCHELAQRAPADTAQLRAIPELPHAVQRKQGDVLLELIAEVMARDADDLPKALPRPLNPEQRNQLKRLKRAAAGIAGELEIDTEALLPAKDYELMVRLASGQPVEQPERWRGWRQDVLVKPLFEEVGAEVAS
ncbi:MAG: ribonuclease D [Halieaceae bacterium]